MERNRTAKTMKNKFLSNINFSAVVAGTILATACSGHSSRNPLAPIGDDNSSGSLLANLATLAEDSDFTSLKDANLILTCSDKQVGNPVKIDMAAFSKNPVAAFTEVNGIKEGESCTIAVRSSGFKSLAGDQQKVYFHGNWNLDESQTAKELGKVYFSSKPSPITKGSGGFDLKTKLYRTYFVTSTKAIKASAAWTNASSKFGNDSELSAFLVCEAIGVIPAKKIEMKVVTLPSIIRQTDGIGLHFNHKDLTGRQSCTLSVTEHRNQKVYDWFATETLDIDLQTSVDRTNAPELKFHLGTEVERSATARP
jgi:hypothetical protein